MGIKKELKEAVQDFEKAKLAKAHLDKIIPRIEDTKIALYRLEKYLEKTDYQIHSVTAPSLKELFTSSLIDKEKQLELDRQRYLETALQYREFKQSLKLLEFERDLLVSKASRLKDLESRLNILVRSREQLLDDSDITLKRAIGRVDRKIMKQFRIKAKTEAAKKQSYKVIEYIYRVLDLFEAINGWGFSQVRRGEENYKIDQSEAYLSKIKQLLITLEDELEAINQMASKPQFNLDIAGGFSSIYIDNLILDWIISGKIRHAEWTLDNVKDRIELILGQLKAFARQTQVEINQLEEGKRALLMTI
ncbi:MAG: hypothetical protein Sapg2KO_11830 [Saprospiraceae bacterium]